MLGELTEEELRKAVISLENDKSPGIDGLTANYFSRMSITKPSGQDVSWSRSGEE